MSAKDHPNNAPGVPMKFPPAVERFQIKYMNPLVKPIAKYLPGMAIIKHRGRSSGKSYETVVQGFSKGNVFAVGLLHGKTNWVKNILAAGEADARYKRRDIHLVNPRVVPAGTDDASLPWIVRRTARSAGVFVADIA